MEIRQRLPRIPKSLRFRIIFPTLALAVVLGLGAYSIAFQSVVHFATERIQEDLENRSREVFDLCDSALQGLLLNGAINDEAAARIRKAKALGAIDEFGRLNSLGILVYSHESRQILLSRALPDADQDLITATREENRVLRLRFKQGEYYARHFQFELWKWHIVLFKDGKVYRGLLSEVQRAYLATGALLAFGYTLLAWYMKRTIITPINSIISSIRYDKPSEYRGIHELEFLSDSIHEMSQREKEKQLMEAEKMTALSCMVAGVAHEINTPVGVSVTAASGFRDSVSDMKKRYQDGMLTKADFEDFIAVTDETSQIILNNLQRAANLIQSFKEVSVDQSSETQRPFNMRDYLEDIFTNLGPMFKRAHLRYDIHCPPGLVVESNPGILAQIITNLSTNAITHAYEPGEHGKVAVRVECMDKQIRLDFTDWGKGIPEDIVGKIFNPFFTTNRGRMSSGLGLHLVYNLVTQGLNGTIVCQSTVGKGTTFTIRWQGL